MTLDVVDAWINPNPPEVAAVWREQKHPREVATRLFARRTEEILRGVPMDELVRQLEAAGITGAVLTAMPEAAPWPIRRFAEWVAGEVEKYPSMFVGSGGVVPTAKMAAVRDVEYMVKELGFKLIRVMPAVVGLPPSHPLYYPIFAKCVELDVPIGLNVGVPGPLVPADTQHPRHVDQVCADFPELTIIASHVGNPWTEELVAYMAKYQNLYLMTSAWAPRYYPRPVIDFLNSSRGKHKVMFASDYPLMGVERCVAEGRELPFVDEDTARAFFAENCRRVLRWA